MYCPACREPLVVLEYDRFEVDYCAACRGVWLDAGELELLYGDADACRDLLEGGGASLHRTRRRCPQCGRRMHERLTGGPRPVTYDRCGHHGLWFDRGELAAVLTQGHPQDREDRVVRFLREVFTEESTPGG